MARAPDPSPLSISNYGVSYSVKGRKPKHIALKLLGGNTGGNKLAEADDPFVCGPVNEPAELDPLAAEE